MGPKKLRLQNQDSPAGNDYFEFVVGFFVHNITVTPHSAVFVLLPLVLLFFGGSTTTPNEKRKQTTNEQTTNAQHQTPRKTQEHKREEGGLH